MLLIMNETEKTRKSIKLIEILSGLGLELSRDYLDIRISGLTDDSRRVQKGDLFVAVPGNKIDGREFIGEALSLGAAAILTTGGKTVNSSAPVIYADDIRTVLAHVADRFYGRPSTRLDIAGITGTNGKTTVSFMVAGIFNYMGKKWGKIGTVGNYLGEKLLATSNTTPGPVEIQRLLSNMVEAGMEGCAMEVSSHALDQRRCEAINFASATFTNLSQDHLDYHLNMEDYFRAKSRLFAVAPHAVINFNDEYGKRLVKMATGKITTFGTTADCDLQYKALEVSPRGSLIEICHLGKSISLNLRAPGFFNIQNAAAAIATCVALGLSLEQTVEGIKNAPQVPGRLQPVVEGQPFAVYIDYAHTPDGLGKLLTSVREFKPNRLLVVFGCGGDRDRKKRPIMGAIAAELADFAIITSDNPRSEDPPAIIREIAAGISSKTKYQIIEDRAIAIKAAISNAAPGDIVVIAGKGHEEYQIIGSVKKYFSDMEAAKSALQKLGYAVNGG